MGVIPTVNSNDSDNSSSLFLWPFDCGYQISFYSRYFTLEKINIYKFTNVPTIIVVSIDDEVTTLKSFHDVTTPIETLTVFISSCIH